MAISSQQAVLTIQRTTMKRAGVLLIEALQPYENARVTSELQSIRYLTGFRGHVTLLAVIDHD